MSSISPQRVGDPKPMKVTMVTHPAYPLETLWYVWEQSRSNRQLPSVHALHKLRMADDPERNHGTSWLVTENGVGTGVAAMLAHLGFEQTPHGYTEFKRRFNATVAMIMNEAIPVTENLYFVFHLENIPISLREQLVRHRIGNHVGPNVSFDIIPELAESTFWSQTSRVIPFDTFYDEGRYLLPATLEGKRVFDPGFSDWLEKTCDAGESFDLDDNDTMDAVLYYKDTLALLQHRYQKLMEAGVHIEDCRQIVPVGATHGITWGINLKALLHIFGKRASWIAQIGLWEEVIAQITQELVDKVDPVFKVLSKPQCMKNGKYIGCPVNGTNEERVRGTDGMPPCPLWVRMETDNAINAAKEANEGKYLHHGVKSAAWQPPTADEGPEVGVIVQPQKCHDLRNWTPPADRPAEVEMLANTAAKFSRLWHLDVFTGQAL